MKEGFVQSLEIEIEDLEPRAEDCTRLIQNPLVLVKISCDVKESGSFGWYNYHFLFGDFFA